MFYYGEVLVLDRLGQTEGNVLALEEPEQFQEMGNQIYKVLERSGSGTQVLYS